MAAAVVAAALWLWWETPAEYADTGGDAPLVAPRAAGWAAPRDSSGGDEPAGGAASGAPAATAPDDRGGEARRPFRFLRVRVVHLDDTPATGARISVTGDGPAIEGRADDAGTARIGPLVPGRVRVRAEAPDYEPAETDAAVPDGEPGGDAEVVLYLVPEGRGSITVEVLQAGADTPVPDVLVKVQPDTIPFGPAHEALLRDHARAGFREATTDERGRVRLERLPEGAMLIVARRIGSRVRPLVETLARGENRTVKLRLTAAGWVTGRVLDAAGRAVAGARVTNTWRRGNTFGTLSDAAGRYVFYFSDPSMQLEATDGRRWSGVVKADCADTTAECKRDLVLADHATVDVTVVVGATGAPVPGAQVCLDPADEAAREHCAAADLAGRSVFAGVRPGRYTAEASADGFADAETPPFDFAGGAVGISTTIRLSEGACIAGTAVDRENRPMRGVVVNAARAETADAGDDRRPFRGGRTPTISDAEGAFRRCGMSDGAWRVTGALREPGRRLRFVPVEVTLRGGRGRDGIVLKLEPALVINGRIVDTDGNVVPTVRAVLSPGGRQSLDGQGRFRAEISQSALGDRSRVFVEGVAADEIVLTAQTDDIPVHVVARAKIPPLPAEIDLEGRVDAGKFNADLTVESSGDARAVLERDNRYVATLWDPAGVSQHVYMRFNAGTARFTRLTPGRYTFQVLMPKPGPGMEFDVAFEQPIDVKAGARLLVDRLKPPPAP